MDDRDLHGLARALRRAIVTAMAEELSEVMITPAEAEVVSELARREQPTMASLSDALGVSAASMSVLVDRLEALGLVSRDRDGSDGRIRRPSLTSEGSTLLVAAEAARSRVRGRMLVGIEPHQIQVMMKAFEVMIEALAPAADHRSPKDGQGR